MSAPPFSQKWIYEFYYKYEQYLSSTQRSIINAVLEGLSDPNQPLKESTASPKQKDVTAKIIQSVLQIYENRNLSK